MPCKFSCSLSYSKAFNENNVSFHSDTGDEYRVKYKSNICRDLLIRIEWSVPKQVLVTVKLYNKTYNRCLTSKGMIINGNKSFMKLRGAFNICKSPDYNLLCVISIFPYINFKECLKSSSLSHTPVTAEESLPIINKNVIMDNSTAMLINTTVKKNGISEKYGREIKPISKKEWKGFSVNSDFASNVDLEIGSVEMQVDQKSETSDCLLINDANESESRKRWKSDLSYYSADDAEIKKENHFALLSTVNAAEKSKEVESQEIIGGSNTIQNGENDERTPDVQMINVLPNDISKMVPLIQYKSNENSQVLPLNDFRDANGESSLAIKEDVFSDTAKSNEIAETEFQKFSIQDQENFALHTIKNISTIKTRTDIHGDSSIKDLSTEINKSMKMEYEEISTHTAEFQGPDDIVNAVLNAADTEINASSVTNDAHDEISVVKEISSKSSIDNYSLILEEVLMNDIQLNAEPSIDSNCDHKKVNFNVENESKNLQMDTPNLINPTESKYEVSINPSEPCKTDDIENIINKADTEIKAVPALNDTYIKRDVAHEFNSPKSSTEISSLILHDALVNDTKFKVTSSFDPKCELKERNSTSESDLKDLSVDNQSPVVPKYSVTNDSVSEICKSVSYVCSEKVDLVSQTLSQRVPLNDSGFKSSNSDEIFSSSEDYVEKTIELNDSCTDSFPVMNSELQGLSMDMLDLLMSGDMADGVITNGKKEIKVHRAIVSARSSVLKEIFSNHTRGNVEYRATVDIPTYILEDLVVFIYVGLVSIKSLKMAKDMYQVAKKYCIKDLVNICSKYISK